MTGEAVLTTPDVENNGEGLEEDVDGREEDKTGERARGEEGNIREAEEAEVA